MDFVSPTFLWALPLATLPVIIHLLNHRRRHVVRWGAMQFLLEVVARRRRRWRINDLLLMLLRALAVIALVLALARPRMYGLIAEPAGPRDVVIVLDTSLSTARAAREGTVFNHLLGQTETTLNNLGPADTVRILLASTTPRWLNPIAVPVTPDARRQLLARLAEISPDRGSADLLRAVREAVHSPAESPRVSRTVAVLTDGQAHGWQAESWRDWRNLAEFITEKAHPATINVTVADATDEPLANLTVTELTTPRPVMSRGERIPLGARVTNTGDVPSEPVLIDLVVDGEVAAVASLPSLAVGESTAVEFEHTAASVGSHRLEVRLARSDDVPLDDTAGLVVETVEQVPILIVQDPPRPGELPSDADYLLACLGHRARADGTGSAYRSAFTPTVVAGYEIDTVALDDYDAVVLADPGPLSDPALDALAAYARTGGGLWIILGAQTDPTSFNAKLDHRQHNLSPYALGQPRGEPGVRRDAERVQPPAANHPATRLLADLQRMDLDAWRIYARHRFDPRQGDGQPTVLLRVADGSPLIIEHQIGHGRAIAQALPFDTRWSNLPLCQSYVVMVHEWLWYLGLPRQTRWNLEPGQTFALTLPAEQVAEPPVVTTPGGREVVATIEQHPTRCMVRFADTDRPGPYALRTISDNGAIREDAFHVRSDPRESDLTALPPAQQERLTEACGLRFTGDGLDPPDPLHTESLTGARPAEPIWIPLLIALLVVLIAESILGAALTRWRSAPAA